MCAISTIFCNNADEHRILANIVYFLVERSFTRISAYNFVLGEILGFYVIR
jgi:hypothetical protein